MEGRWTITVNPRGQAVGVPIGDANPVSTAPGYVPVPVVPCDDAAVERVARFAAGDRYWDLHAKDEDEREEMRRWARAALRAAGETP